MSIETTPADLASAVSAARNIAALVPQIKHVRFLETVPNSTHAARQVYMQAAIAAWQMAAMVYVRMVQEKDTEDCRIDWTGCLALAMGEKSLTHLEAMTQDSSWMAFELSQAAVDAMDGDK